MSIAGFKARNHPQQTAKCGTKDAVDDRGTDQAFFDTLSERFGGFTLDVYVEPFRDRPASPLRVEFLRGRMRFDRPGWTPGPKGDRPPFGCCLLIWGPR